MYNPLNYMSKIDNEFSYKPGSPYEADGFVGGSVMLPGLELSLKLSSKHHFKFDGVVPDMGEYLKTLSTDMRHYLDKYSGDLRFRTAFNMGFVWEDHIGMFMAVKDVSPRVNLSNISHEAAEIAYQLGYRKKLQRHLRKLGVEGSIKGLKTHEVGALFGIVMPRTWGMDVADLYKFQDPGVYQNLKDKGFI
jgi:hypothetical protein